ncbi:hypothetical protein D9757_004687 [Collybiopsis confluens]|uniref:Uncharacterized protein n=1 Tax=Collybiopsis confluens TaxID=2823264 RepID=A0A8H5MCG8_9AGAR|nr:hypothetical protein D9757_004687 [Collybiopsis confluens]
MASADPTFPVSASAGAFFERHSIVEPSEALPPSPILSPSVMASICTSEEVPIFLFSSNSNDEIESRRVSSTSCLVSSVSAGTVHTARSCATFGTFGQFRTQPLDSRTSDLQPQTDSSRTSTLVDYSSTNQAVTNNFASPSPGLDLRYDQPDDDSSKDAVSTRSMYYSTYSYTSSSLSDLCYVTHGQTISHGYAGDLHSTSSLSDYPNLYRDSAISLPSVSDSHWPRYDRKASSAAGDLASFPRLFLPPSPESIPDPMSSHADLPRTLAWLKDTVVEMLIDQEGFRSICPCFRFAGYSTNTRSLDPNDKEIEGGAAHFIPVTRQTFNFHYAPFDGQPVLRRISVKGNSRDHVSRQATISLKSNGVYEVRGIETSLISSKMRGLGTSVEAPKLRWKLDYYVDDRKGSGRREGEKTLMPLAFSCSPLLLHPLQGRKIKLMQVMRKNVVSKLVAEKMELPQTTASRSSSPLPLRSSPSPPRTDPSKAHLWHLHRRFLSHGHSNNHARSEGDEFRRSKGIGDGEPPFRPLSLMVPRRNQRTSPAMGIAVVDLSFGETAQESDEVKGGETRNPMTFLSPNRSLPEARYDRHILPPSKLSELLEVEDMTSHGRKVGQVFVGLTPAPRSHKFK